MQFSDLSYCLLSVLLFHLQTSVSIIVDLQAHKPHAARRCKLVDPIFLANVALKDLVPPHTPPVVTLRRVGPGPDCACIDGHACAHECKNCF